MTFRYLIPLLCFAGSALAQQQSLDEQITAAEAPVTEFRENYRKALQRKRDEAQAKGRLEDVKLHEQDLKEFEAGGWPDGDGINAELEATFIIHYWRVQPKADAALRKLAAKANSPEVNARIQKRLEHWGKKPPGMRNPGTKLVNFQWKLRQSPVASGVFGSSEGRSLKDMFTDMGVTFPDGASIVYAPNGSLLLVKNNAGNLIFIEQILRSKNLL